MLPEPITTANILIPLSVKSLNLFYIANFMRDRQDLTQKWQPHICAATHLGMTRISKQTMLSWSVLGVVVFAETIHSYTSPLSRETLTFEKSVQFNTSQLSFTPFILHKSKKTTTYTQENTHVRMCACTHAHIVKNVLACEVLLSVSWKLNCIDN